MGTYNLRRASGHLGSRHDRFYLHVVSFIRCAEFIKVPRAGIGGLVGRDSRRGRRSHGESSKLKIQEENPLKATLIPRSRSSESVQTHYACKIGLRTNVIVVFASANSMTSLSLASVSTTSEIDVEATSEPQTAGFVVFAGGIDGNRYQRQHTSS